MRKLYILLLVLLFAGLVIGFFLQFPEPSSEPVLYENNENNLNNSGKVLLNVPFFRQEEEWYCSEASAVMILQYYGYENITQDFVNENMAINFETMVKPLENYLENISYAVLNIENLKAEINENDPVIVRISSNNVRHTIVVVGYDFEGNLIVHDPALGENLVITEETLKKYWVSIDGGYIAISIR